MDFTPEQMRRFQEAVDQGKMEYERRKKMEESLRRREMEKKRRDLGIKVIRTDKESNRGV